jgi:hypothetical protein
MHGREVLVLVWRRGTSNYIVALAGASQLIKARKQRQMRPTATGERFYVRYNLDNSHCLDYKVVQGRDYSSFLIERLFRSGFKARIEEI